MTRSTKTKSLKCPDCQKTVEVVIGSHRCVECSKARRKKLTRERYAPKRSLTVAGLTVSEYEAMLKHQKDKCAVCLQVPTHKRRMSAMRSGSARGGVWGLVCVRCQNAVATVSPENLEFAIEYLRRYA